MNLQRHTTLYHYEHFFLFVYPLLEHEGPVTAVGITQDGLRILAGTSTGNLGILDISTRNYTTLMRSHTQRVLAMSLDPVRRQLATVSEDHTIRIWDLDTSRQVLYTADLNFRCYTAPCNRDVSHGAPVGNIQIFVDYTCRNKRKQNEFPIFFALVSCGLLCMFIFTFRPQ